MPAPPSSRLVFAGRSLGPTCELGRTGGMHQMSARTTAAPRALLAALIAVLMLAGVLGGVPSGTARAGSAPRVPADPATPATGAPGPPPTVPGIGRASCRGRVEISVGGGS